MKTKIITAQELMEDDWFLLAGNLYRVGTINTYHNGTVGIQFYDPSQEDPASLYLHNLSVTKDLRMQIFNQ